jgi:hypothetical protein
MSSWLGHLLLEWQRRSAASPQRDDVCAADHDGVAQAPTALDLLRKHVKTADALPRFIDAGNQTNIATAAAPPTTADKRPAGAPTAGAQFGRRRTSRYVDDSTPADVSRYVPLSREVSRSSETDSAGAPGKMHAGPFKGIRKLDGTNHNTRDEIAVLRSEVAHLKETLADLMVENRVLKRWLAAGGEFRAADEQPESASTRSDVEALLARRGETLGSGERR